MDYTKEFLGGGWAFPVGVEKTSGRVKLARYEEDIEQAIKIILMTRRGERLMRPEFGSRLHEYLFETDTYGTRSRIREAAEEALRLWEPRITDVEAEADFPQGSTGGFRLRIRYRVRSTNNPFNLVFPFCVTEGT
ncbi:MAG: GPW/gp25 family protein [Oscillospiraceae bacterium]|jgi:phage baseplate assembly protein W|nr:GPW/gp25 family protein [Oscillospiraceae bacterium]